MNYSVQNHQNEFDVDFWERLCRLSTKDDPLLIRTLEERESFCEGVYTAIATALSQPLLRSPPISPLSIKHVGNWLDHLADRIKPSDTICQIGFGGAIDLALQPKAYDRLIVSDLFFSSKFELDRAHSMAEERGLHLSAIEFRNAPIDPSTLASADVVCISGSTLCNDTLTDLLLDCRGARIVILQGPSCSVFAPSLFEAGITQIYAPLKTKVEWHLAIADNPKLITAVDGNYVSITPAK